MVNLHGQDPHTFPAEKVEKEKDNSVKILDNLGRIIKNVKPISKKNMTSSKTKQIVEVVKYLSNLAVEEKIITHSLWLDEIPNSIYLNKLEEKYNYNKEKYILNPIVGEYDDPFNQKQHLLTLPLSTEGNTIIYGASGSGKENFLKTMIYSLIKDHTVEEFNLYIIDLGSETLKIFENASHVGDIIYSQNSEKVGNLLKMLLEEVQKRKNTVEGF